MAPSDPSRVELPGPGDTCATIAQNGFYALAADEKYDTETAAWSGIRISMS